jgi:hypothetical protein
VGEDPFGMEMKWSFPRQYSFSIPLLAFSSAPQFLSTISKWIQGIGMANFNLNSLGKRFSNCIEAKLNFNLHFYDIFNQNLLDSRLRH